MTTEDLFRQAMPKWMRLDEMDEWREGGTL